MVGSCSVGSCEKVNTSKWATFMGMPVAAWGVLWYVTMFALAVYSTAERHADSASISLVLLAFAGIGFLFSAYLTYLELFVIYAICQWCVVSAIVVTIILLITIADYREKTALLDAA